MRHGKLLDRRLADERRYAGDLTAMLWREFEPRKLPDVGDDVEHPAPAHIHRHLAKIWNLDDLVEMGCKGRNIAEGDALDLPFPAFGADADQPGGCLEHQLRHGFLHRDHAHLE